MLQGTADWDQSSRPALIGKLPKSQPGTNPEFLKLLYCVLEARRPRANQAEAQRTEKGRPRDGTAKQTSYMYIRSFHMRLKRVCQ